MMMMRIKWKMMRIWMVKKTKMKKMTRIKMIKMKIKAKIWKERIINRVVSIKIHKKMNRKAKIMKLCLIQIDKYISFIL